MWTENGIAFPDSLVGTDSHTTMVNGLGVFGWGVGGIEAEAVMLGQPMAMLIPEVVGFELTGKLPAGTTATDLVLTVPQMLRKKGVVDQFVEFTGSGGIGALSLPIARRSPLWRRSTARRWASSRSTPRRSRICASRATPTITSSSSTLRRRNTPLARPGRQLRFSYTLSLDLSTVEPSIAGPARPQDRVPLKTSRRAWRRAVSGILGDKCEAETPALAAWSNEGGHAAPGALNETREITTSHGTIRIGHGSVVIAAITCCTNTSNPSVLLAAGLLAKKAVAKGL